MGKFARVKSIVLAACIVAGLGGGTVSDPAEAGPLVFDEEIGHYKDLSYEALSDEGLSWEERASLFGGETTHYGELTDKERKAKQKELKALLATIKMKETNNWADPNLLARVETEIRTWLDRQIVTWLDGQIKQIPAAYVGRDVYKLRTGAVGFFRAYEIFGDKKYLEAGLKCADVIMKKQWPKGHWPWGTLGENFVRIQDGYNDGPFWVMLYAYKVSGDKKYFESARRCADLLLSLQRPGGGWSDQWSFSGQGSGHTGVIHGISFNDNATNSTFQIMVMMYHMTGNKKYIANLHKLGKFIAKSKMGEGKVVGWAEQYHDDGRPVRARQYEIELPYPRALTRGVGPLLVWFYLIDGDEAHMDLLKKAYAWHEYVRQQELDPKVLAQWKDIAKAWSPAHHVMSRDFMMEYRPGWPDAWLPDGSNWGRVLSFRLMAWKPLTAEQKKKYGNLIDHSWPPVSELARLARANQLPPRNYGMYVYCHSSVGNSLSEVRRALLEHKRGGRKGMLKYYSNPTKYTPDQYLQARIDAAKRVLNPRNRRLAYPFVGAPGYTGMSAMKDFGFIGAKGRWYGRQGTKWGRAFDRPYPSSSGAWYQWQLVYDVKLAQGKIDADAAARGGRGLETVASMTHLDSWDVLGEWGMACHEMENHFDVPIGKK